MNFKEKIYQGLPNNLKDITDLRFQALNEKKVKGFFFNLGVGTKKFDLQLSGSARQLLGLNFGHKLQEDDRVTLIINNDVILDQASVAMLSGREMHIAREFFEFPRALSGQDNISLTIETVSAHPISVNFYYI